MRESPIGNRIEMLGTECLLGLGSDLGKMRPARAGIRHFMTPVHPRLDHLLQSLL
jgi:hypothetical protein